MAGERERRTAELVTRAAMGGELRYRLTDDELVLEVEDRKPRRIRLRHVARVQLTRVRNLSVCRVVSGKGNTIEITCAGPKHGTDPEMSRAYSAFVEALHHALAEEAPDVRCGSGSRALLVGGILISVLGGTLLALHLLGGGRELRTILKAVVLAATGIGALVAGRPKSYPPGQPPAELLP
jgi:hypothetical protein